MSAESQSVSSDAARFRNLLRRQGRVIGPQFALAIAMGTRGIGIALWSSMLAGGIAAQTVAVIRSGPLATPEDIATLESHVLQNAQDLEARVALLRVYMAAAPPPGYDDPGRRSVRLQHILFLVEHDPEAAVSASKVAYVSSVNGPYANAADHEAVRGEWLAAVQAHPRDSAVILNAAKFLEHEDPSDAERVLRRSVDNNPGNREIAANLGFLYAKEILGALGAHGAEELENSTNAIVLAAAGTALPNLAVRSNGGREVDPKIFAFAEELSTRARRLAPDDADLQGPMPLIQYFSAREERARQSANNPTR